MVKNPPANAAEIRDVGLIPGLGRSPGGGLVNPLQYSYLENPHGPRSLAGYSPWGRKELGTAEETEHACTLPQCLAHRCHSAAALVIIIITMLLLQ